MSDDNPAGAFVFLGLVLLALGIISSKPGLGLAAVVIFALAWLAEKGSE